MHTYAHIQYIQDKLNQLTTDRPRPLNNSFSNQWDQKKRNLNYPNLLKWKGNIDNLDRLCILMGIYSKSDQS